MTANALIGQSGGPTAVINESLVGIVETAVGTDGIDNVFGALNGIQGVLDDRLIDVGRESPDTLEAVARTPSSALRSVRKKPTQEDCEQIIDRLRQRDVRYFFYIGGNDSAETAHILNEIAVAQAYDVRLFHIPKTIDNDLRVTDHCPGYGSAAKFVALAFMGDNQDNRSLAGIKIDVVMGRHAGWLTAASVLARQHADDGPHLVYTPESVFDEQQFVADVGRVHAELGRCVVAVSEGVHDANGDPIFKTDEVDSHGNVQLSGSGALGDHLARSVKRGLGEGLRVRADTFGYLQRSFAGVRSEVDAEEARRVGRHAVTAATSEEHRHGSVYLERVEGSTYHVECGVTALENVARVTRDLDAGYRKGSNDIDESFLDYVAPLVGELPTMGRLNDFATN